MNPICENILNRIKEVYQSSKHAYEYLGPDGYAVAITKLFGHAPENLEIDLVFENRSYLELATFEDIVKEKILSINEFNFIQRMFLKLDYDMKGEITIDDLRKCWHTTINQLPWINLWDAFQEVATNGTLKFSRFREICTIPNKTLIYKQCNCIENRNVFL